MVEEVSVTFKSSGNKKYTMTIPTDLSISDLKTRLAPEFNIPVDRQRLIYSGKVLKDNEKISTYNVQSGHTIHLVKSAAPSSGNAANSSSTSSNSSTSGSVPSAVPGAPTNIAAGTGAGNPLAGLTGARYAGHVQLPSASMFGPDGGMGPPPSEEQMIQMMSSPEYQQSLNQMLQNPQMLDYLISSSPALQGMGPEVRQLMQSEYFRNMMTNSEMLRQMMEMSRSMRGTSGSAFGSGLGMPGSQESFPAPGAPTGTQDNSTSTTESTNTNNNTTTPATGNTTQSPAANNLNPSPYNLFSFFNPALAGATPNTNANPGNPTTNSPFPNVNPEMLNNFLSAMRGGDASSAPFSDPSLAGLNFGALAGAANPAAQANSNEPPEILYESQLRQLNELGFHDFDRNVRALRRSGGIVQNAVEALLDNLV